MLPYGLLHDVWWGPLWFGMGGAGVWHAPLWLGAVGPAFGGCCAVFLGNGSMGFCDFVHVSQFPKILGFGIWP